MVLQVCKDQPHPQSQHQEDMGESLPLAALQRMAPLPLEEEWNVPVRPFSELNSAPVAVLLTQHPSQIGLKGYPSNEVHCSLIIKQEDGEDKIVTVRRHLVQIGFGEPVQKLAMGPKITLPKAMIKMVAKLPVHLAKHCDFRAIEQILCRDNFSATFMAHESVIHNL